VTLRVRRACVGSDFTEVSHQDGAAPVWRVVVDGVVYLCSEDE
jgi:hypothetical protein